MKKLSAILLAVLLSTVVNAAEPYETKLINWQKNSFVQWINMRHPEKALTKRVACDYYAGEAGIVASIARRVDKRVTGWAIEYDVEQITKVQCYEVR